jgi:HEAT repeat protein
VSEIDRIQKLLESDSIETRIAAAIVLGELRPKQPSVALALVKVLDSPVPVLQRHALEALTQIGSARKATKRAFELLTSNVEEVRRAAQAAITSIGEEVVPTIRERMPHALPEERRALDAILAELGGKDAFTTLLSGLASSEGEATKATALAVRQHVREAGARERKSYLAETEKFLQGLEPKKKTKPKKGEIVPPPDPKQTQAKAAAVKILGYLEDERAIPTLMAYATDESQPPVVRQEAIIGLRFAIGSGKTPSKLVDALIDAAESPDRMLAQTALHTLGGLELPPAAAKRLEKLAAHPDVGRVQFVIEHLGRLGTPDAVRALVNIVCTADRRRAEIAAGVLGGREDAIAPLGKALLETKDADRAWMIRNVLRPTAKKLSGTLRKQLLEEAMDRLESGARGWEALLDVVRDADPAAVADALRSLATKLRKSNADKAMTVLALLCRSDKATDADRYALASLELQKGSRDTRPTARAGDPALQKLAALLGRGFDVGAALRKDRSVDLEHLYYVGFHFAEEGHPIGEELLGEVVKKGGRSKVAKMAKNKLALVEGAA